LGIRRERGRLVGRALGGKSDVPGWALCKEGLRTTYLIKYKDVWVCTMVGDPDSIRSVDPDPEY
jgi:hypothetical protein